MKNLLTGHFTRLIVLPLVLFCQSLSFGQSQNAGRLEEAIGIYEEMYEYSSFVYELQGFYEDFDFDTLIIFQQKGDKILYQVLSSGTEQEKKAARYFSMLMNIELVYAYSHENLVENMFELIEDLDDELKEFTMTNAYPISYFKGDVKYTVNYTDYKLLGEDMVSFSAELYELNGMYTKSIYWSDRGLSMLDATPWTRYLCSSFKIRSKKALGQLDNELVNAALMQLDAILLMDDGSDRKKVASSVENAYLGTEPMLEAMRNSPSLYSNGNQYSKAAQNLAKLNLKRYALMTYAQMIEQGINEIEYLNEALNYFKPFADNSDISSLDYQLWAFTNNGALKNTALKAAERMESQLTKETDCSYWINLRDHYTWLGVSSKANEMDRNYADCKKAEAKKMKKENRISESDLGFYLGVYPFPMIWGNFGGIAQINLNKVSLGFNYTLIGHDRDYQSDFYNPIKGNPEYMDLYGNELDREKIFWDGTRMSVMLKCFISDNSDSRGYFMLNGGVVNKQYEPFDTRILDVSTSYPVYVGPISPTEVKYFGNIGIGLEQQITEHWVVDMGMGIGIGKAKLSLDSPYFDDPAYFFESYTMQDAATEAIGMSAFFNMSIGYKFFR